jgi:hypothetical protein
VTAIIVIVVLIAVAIGIAAALGAGPLVLVVVPIALARAGWMLVFGASRMRPREVAERAPSEDLLGPGGADDPRASR